MNVEMMFGGPGMGMGVPQVAALMPPPGMMPPMGMNQPMGGGFGGGMPPMNNMGQPMGGNPFGQGGF